MKASILDLRYKMKEVLKALERNERVEILYHGKLKGIIEPYRKVKKKKVSEHPFFGMCADDRESVEKKIDKLRKGRYDDF